MSKALVIKVCGGEYDGYYESIEGMFLVPDEVEPSTLFGEYQEYVRQKNAESKAARLAVPKPERKKIKSVPFLRLEDWIEQVKMWPRLPFCEIEK